MKRKIIFTLCLIGLLLSCNAYSLPEFFQFFIATTHANCALAEAITSPDFCKSFETVAACHCVSSGVPAGMCNMDWIYTHMVDVFKDQQRACDHQKDVPAQACMDDWNCYRHGGTDSQGNLCSGTGKSCQ